MKISFIVNIKQINNAAAKKPDIQNVLDTGDESSRDSSTVAWQQQQQSRDQASGWLIFLHVFVVFFIILYQGR